MTRCIYDVTIVCNMRTNSNANNDEALWSREMKRSKQEWFWLRQSYPDTSSLHGFLFFNHPLLLSPSSAAACLLGNTSPSRLNWRKTSKSSSFSKQKTPESDSVTWFRRSRYVKRTFFHQWFLFKTAAWEAFLTVTSFVSYALEKWYAKWYAD